MNNRPIKFRAWDKKNKRWLKDEDFLISPQYGGVFEWFFDGGTSKIALDDIELMQFTGLTDKNGKEIYEGDILKHTNGDIAPMTWIDDYSCFAAVLSDQTHQYYQRVDEKKLEVIGTIYENPELLTN